MIISLAALKCFWKNSTLFHDKSLREIGDTIELPKHNKGSLQQAYTQTQIKRREFKAISLVSETEGWPLSLSRYQYST